MLLGIIILDDYTTNYINITPKANHDVKYFIINTLQTISFLASTKPENISLSAFFGIF